MACYCCGDIEDHDTGEEYTGMCTCCESTSEPDDFDEETFIEGTTMKDPGPL